jgi:hypothetical protein
MGVKVVLLEKITIKRHMKMDTNEFSVKETVATLKGIPTEEQLNQMLREQFLTVTFLKLDGDRRVMTCTKSQSVIPEASLPKTGREPKPGTINVWDVNAKGWRSFRYDRVQSVETSVVIASHSC